ncbi:MAG: hypothetical protein EA341_16280 [Mongoliibacter sp.]|uniref:hypothetical protein n=1 Tax=Mongoliibacter sp. TaxID=2022438 RepID=UPI0012F3878C|nr:hypothetical protein [Mongoliibacter sp.]TVP44773.1 MAG: hypothetical protein EA341_16280 [Mongoliibacter sp.]
MKKTGIKTILLGGALSLLFLIGSGNESKSSGIDCQSMQNKDRYIDNGACPIAKYHCCGKDDGGSHH